MEERTQNSLSAIKVGIYGNVVLAIFKIVLGIVGLSVALIADGGDTVADVVKSFFIYRAVKLSSRPPTEEYPYGYGRAETIITNIVGMSVIFAGLLIFMEALGKFGATHPLGFVMVIGASISIAGKFILSFYMFVAATRYSNQALLANAKDYLSDVFASVAVLVGGILVMTTHISYFDALASMVVAGLIAYMGVEIVKSGIPEIMEKNENMKMLDEIVKLVKETPYVFRPHKVRIRKLGPYYLVDMHLELPGKMSLKKAHETVTYVEKVIKEKFPQIKEVTVHAEPIGQGGDEW